MQKIYLVSPKDKFLEKAGDRCPLGIMYLSSYLKNKGHYVKLFDLNHDTEYELFDHAAVDKPDFIGFSIPTPLFDDVYEIAQNLKLQTPNSKLIAGGIHPTNYPNEPRYNLFDYVVRGEGEIITNDILEGKLNQHVINADRIENLDDLPVPDYPGIQFERYTMRLNNRKAALIISSRGCIYSCIYCSSAKLKKVKFRSPENIVSEMAYLFNNYGVRGFYFGDDVFTLNKKRVMDLCDKIIDADVDITWRCTTRANLVDQELLDKMKESGCDILSLGIETHNDYFLKLINKGTTKQQNEEAVKLAKQAGMKVKGFFILGLPNQTYKDCIDTIKYAISLNLDYVDFYPLSVYPNTELWDTPEKFNLSYQLPDGNWSEYYQVGKENHEWKVNHPNITPQQMNDLLSIAKKATKRGLTYE